MAKSLVVITGASSGIGEAFARRLAHDHDLLLVARRKDRLQALAGELGTANDSQIEVLEADLTLDADVARLAERLENDERLALLVNNAGFGTRGRFWEAPLKDQEQMHRLHVMTPLKLMHSALRNMARRDAGAIINVASVAAFIRTPGSASYCATKTWMTAFSEAIHLELKGAGSQIVVQSLCPGYTYSEFHDVLGADRQRLAPRAFWYSAAEVVDASLEGLRQRRLYVIPGWRYRWLVSVLTKLPTALRLALEERRGPRKRASLPSAGDGNGRNRIADQSGK